MHTQMQRERHSAAVRVHRLVQMAGAAAALVAAGVAAGGAGGAAGAAGQGAAEAGGRCRGSLQGLLRRRTGLWRHLRRPPCEIGRALSDNFLLPVPFRVESPTACVRVPEASVLMSNAAPCQSLPVCMRCRLASMLY